MTIREAEDRDFPGIVECMLSGRGDSYYERNMYDRDYLRNSDKYKFYVAVTEYSEIAGIIAMTSEIFKTDWYLLSMLTIKEQYKNMKIASELFKKAVDASDSFSILKAYVVTDNTYVQHIAESHGFVPSGFLFGVKDGSKMTPPLSYKRTLAVCTFNIQKKNAGILFIDGSLKDMTNMVYKPLNAEYTLSSDFTAGERSVIYEFYDSFHNVIYLHITACGNDLSKKLEELIDISNRASAKTIIIFLNINDPSAVFGFRILREMKFVFSGFNPLGDSGEQIIMFYGSCDFEKIKTTERPGELLREVLAYE